MQEELFQETNLRGHSLGFLLLLKSDFVLQGRVLGNDVSDPHGLNVTSFGKRVRVLMVGSSEVEMVSAAFNIKSHRVGAHVVKKASSVPRVELSIAENDVVVVFEVQLGVAAAEEAQSPVVLGSQAKFFLAIFGVLLVVPGSGKEHVGDSILADGHRHLVTSEDGPAVSIQAPLVRVAHIVARGHSASVVVVDLNSGIKSNNVIFIIDRVDVSGLLTRVLDWVSWHREDEAGGIWVVDHSHGSEGTRDSVDDAFNFKWASHIITQIEGLLDEGVLVFVELVAVENLESLSNDVRAGSVVLSE